MRMRNLLLAGLAACAFLGGPAASAAEPAAARALMLVKTTPPGAEVKSAGATLGTTPLLLTTLATDRTYTFELFLNGYQKRKITVSPEGRTPLVREETLVLDSGTVDCKTEPAGATILVNGVERGVTPAVVPNVPKGLASITFRLEGYRDEMRELRLVPGDRQTLSIALKEKPARLTVVSSPEKARVFVDGDYQGKTPVTMSSVAPGAHKIKLDLAGHAPVTRDITLVRGGEATEEFRLASVLGRLEIVTTPAGAKIVLDGRAVGTTRSQGGDVARSHVLGVEKVAAGEHSVVAHLAGFREAARKVTVNSDETRQLFIRLSRVFEPDTEVETVNGTAPVRGVLISNDPLAVVLEVRPGVQQSIPRGDVRKVTPLTAK